MFEMRFIIDSSFINSFERIIFTRLIFIPISLVDMDISKFSYSSRECINIHFVSISSTHFLTGDGGFIQAVMMGYAGLRYDAQSLLFQPQPGLLTAETESIRLRNVLVRGTYPFEYTIDRTSMNFLAFDPYQNLLCITDNQGHQWKITNTSVKLSFQTVNLPVRVDLCN